MKRYTLLAKSLEPGVFAELVENSTGEAVSVNSVSVGLQYASFELADSLPGAKPECSVNGIVRYWLQVPRREVVTEVLS